MPPEGRARFEGFEVHRIETEEATVRARVGGSGPGLLRCTAFRRPRDVARDRPAPRAGLHGGRSGPPGLRRKLQAGRCAYHQSYSKRAMARDQIAVMRRFGFERFAVVSHDRGARAATGWR